MDYQLNIPALVRGFFATNGNLLFYPGAALSATEKAVLASYPEVKILSYDDIQQDTSYLGTPIFFPITFEGGQYQVYRNGAIELVTLGDFRLPLATMASFRRAKKYSETSAVGGVGVVTETYAHSDWQIEIYGLCLDEPNHPHGADTFLIQHKRILEFENLVDAIKVRADLFSMKGIYSLKINEVGFQPTQGKPRVLSYTLSCSSVTPFELILQ